MSGFPINPPRAPLVDPDSGIATNEFYRFLVQIQKAIGGPYSPFDDVALLSHDGRAVNDSDEIVPAGVAPVNDRDDVLTPPYIPQEACDNLAPPNPLIFALLDRPLPISRAKMRFVA